MKEPKKLNNNSEADIPNSLFVRVIKKGQVESLDKQSANDILVIYRPIEIVERRHHTNFSQSHKNPSNNEPKNFSADAEAIEKLILLHNLSHRQAQVALKCAEGLSNAQISAQLLIRQETVKFHLRNIFIKTGVRRRGELIAYLFRHELIGLIGKGNLAKERK